MLNKVQLIGNLGADPELKEINGSKLVNLSIATKSGYKDKSGKWQDKTDWFQVSLWNNLAETASKYLHKGSRIYIEGKLQNRSWEENGVKKYATDIIGNQLIMLDSKEQF